MHCVYSVKTTHPKTCWVSFIWLALEKVTWLYVQILYLIFAWNILVLLLFLLFIAFTLCCLSCLSLLAFVLFLLHCTLLCSCVFFETCPLFLLPAFQSELRHGPFYYMKQPALTTDPVDVVPQDGRNDFYCWLCHREGQVLCCELCPRVYHAKCLKLPAEPEGDWFCPECEVLTQECL